MKEKTMLILNIIVWCVGLFCLIIGSQGGPDNLNLGLNATSLLLIKIFGGIILLSALVLIILTIFNIPKTDKTIAIEENDERNIAIRGKAAQVYQLVTPVINFVLVIVFIMLEMYLPSIIIAVAALIEVWVLLFAIGHYSKTM